MKKFKRRHGHSPVLNIERCDLDPNTQLEVEQVFPPPSQRLFVEQAAATRDASHNPFVECKMHRCTYYKPSNEDFGQSTNIVLPPNDYFHNLLQEIRHDHDTSGTTKQRETKNACQGSTIETCSKFVEPASGMKMDETVMADLLDDAPWQTLDSVSQVDKFLPHSEHEAAQTAKKRSPSPPSFPNIRISETPRVKRIAEKFLKFKRNNVELRRLEDRVVCLEYDVFNQDSPDQAVPLQKMRAFFSVKTKTDGNDKENIDFIPSGVKRDFNIEDGDLQKLKKVEIEIIDEQIAENRSYLEDLKRVLRRKQALKNKKRQQTLDLMYLYEMAKRECPPIDHNYSNIKLLSKAELQEIKDLILKKCDSSVHGINRRTVQCSKGDLMDDAKCLISNSLIWEMMREPEKV